MVWNTLAPTYAAYVIGGPQDLGSHVAEDKRWAQMAATGRSVANGRYGACYWRSRPAPSPLTRSAQARGGRYAFVSGTFRHTQVGRRCTFSFITNCAEHLLPL